MKFTIVIPAYNEEENLGPLIKEIISFGDRSNWDYELIIVDDNSTDDTAYILNNYVDKYNFIKILHRCSHNRGMGLALKEGTAQAKNSIIIWMMADRADQIETVPTLLQTIAAGYDLVFASRYMPGGSRGDLDCVKAFLSSRYTLLLKLLFGLEVHDVTNAFRAFKKEIFFKLKIKAADFSISPEFAIKAHLAGYKLAEVPTRYKDRKAGKSKFKILHMMVVYMMLLINMYFMAFIIKLRRITPKFFS